METLRQEFRLGKRRTIFGSLGECWGRTVYQTEDCEIMERCIKASRRSSRRPLVLTRDEVKDENRVLDAAETMLIGPKSRQISAVGWRGGASAACS